MLCNGTPAFTYPVVLDQVGRKVGGTSHNDGNVVYTAQATVLIIAFISRKGCKIAN
jgi:hypothetical protein